MLLRKTKACLEIILFSLPKIQVKNKITDQKKYDYLFSVDTLNNDVISGKPFQNGLPRFRKIY